MAMRATFFALTLALLLGAFVPTADAKVEECAPAFVHGDGVDVCYSPIEGWPSAATDILEAVRLAFLSGVSVRYFADHFDFVRLSVFGSGVDLYYRFSLDGYTFEDGLTGTYDPPTLTLENFIRPREVLALVPPEGVLQAGLSCRQRSDGLAEFVWDPRIGPGFLLYASGTLNQRGYDSRSVLVDLETGDVIDCDSPSNLLPGQGEQISLHVDTPVPPTDPASAWPSAIVVGLAVGGAAAAILLTLWRRRNGT